jgi:uncharacterized membrane protein
MSKGKKISLYSMAFIYVAAGINHFVSPVFYKNIMPPWLPWHYPLITISGAAEIILGFLLLPAATRQWTAWGIIVLLVAVFPANVQMMINYREQQHPYLWIAILRLPLQLLLIRWAYQFASNNRR